jgi:hypothetical protein
MRIDRKPADMGLPFGKGKPTIQTQTEMLPTGDKIIGAVRDAFWDAWQIGLQQSGSSMYPRLPLLDREPMEPEM